MSIPRKIPLCIECRARPQPTDSCTCAECEAKVATWTLKPRRTERRLRCDVCGAPEGDPHDWTEHEVYREKHREERAREERIAELLAAKLAAPAVEASPLQKIGNAEKAAATLGLQVATFRKRVQRGQYRDALLHRGKGRYEYILDRLVPRRRLRETASLV